MIRSNVSSFLADSGFWYEYIGLIISSLVKQLICRLLEEKPMRHFLFAMLIPAGVVFAGDVPLEKIWYRDYERAYFFDDARTVGLWLTKNPKITETMHFVDGSTKTSRISRKDLLKRILDSPSNRPMPDPDWENIKIEKGKNGAFCGYRVLENSYERRVRKVCFIHGGKVTEQTIDIFEKPIN